MALPASQTGDRLVSVLVRRLFSGKALYGLASVRAAVKEGRHCGRIGDGFKLQDKAERSGHFVGPRVS